MDFEDTTVRWNPHICDDTKDELEKAEFVEVPENLINNDHSSDSLKWDGGNFFSKQKGRKPSNTIQELTRTGEFDHIFSLYNEHHDTSIHAPTPYCAVIYSDNDTVDQVVMDFMGGDDWMSFPRAFSGGEFLMQEDEVRSVCYSLGEFAKILENENMAHGDVAWRHFYVDPEHYDVAAIDIEGGTTDARESTIQGEQEELQSILDKMPRPQYEEAIYDGFQDGYESVPDPENTDLPRSEYECEGDYGLTQKALDLLR